MADQSPKVIYASGCHIGVKPLPHRRKGIDLASLPTTTQTIMWYSQ